MTPDNAESSRRTLILRAKIVAHHACYQSASYAVELATGEKRVLGLAADGGIELATSMPGPRATCHFPGSFSIAPE